jgi:hypothetical protein
MSFCSPTIGSGRPRTVASNNAACSTLAPLFEFTARAAVIGYQPEENAELSNTEYKPK